MAMMGFSPDRETLRLGPDGPDGADSWSVAEGLPAPGLVAAPHVMKPGVPVRRRTDDLAPPNGTGGTGGMDGTGTSGSGDSGSTAGGVPAALRRRGPGVHGIQPGLPGGTVGTGRPPATGVRGMLGLPGPLRAGLESLSGFDMSDVRVHYNSAEPARHHALAYTNGSDIEVGPGHEEHLAHEGWHVVQQKQGRVTSRLQMKGAPLNADPLLEREADEMGARAATRYLGDDHNGSWEQPEPSRRQVSVAAPALQLKGEKEFMKDPSAFMDGNQVLVAFDEGVQQTYSLPPGMVEKIKTRQDALAADAMQKVGQRREQDVRNGKNLGEDAYALSIAMAKDMNTPDAIKRKGDNFLTQLMSEAMSAVKCTMFTFATRTVQKGMFGFGGSTQYIVTPLLESMERSIPEDTMTTAPDGTQISLRAALEGLKRIQPVDGVVQAAYIPYESNPNKVTGETSVDVPIDGDIKVAFTAAMNGCSLAIKKKSDTEMTVWHFPSPDNAPEVWAAFKEEHGIDATYDWDEYNGLTDQERFRLMKNHVTTTVMIRDDEGWKIKSQQNVGPEGGKQQTDLLKLGKVYEKRLEIGEEATAEVVDGAVEAHPT
jgi:hypothetical protein